MENNAEQPAYPVLEFNPQIKSLELSSIGLTKRELLSAMAMQGILSSGFNEPGAYKEAAKRSIAFTDELLSQLQSKP